jgi:hypothetical protein
MTEIAPLPGPLSNIVVTVGLIAAWLRIIPKALIRPSTPEVILSHGKLNKRIEWARIWRPTQCAPDSWMP